MNRWQFSLRTLLLVTVILSVVLAIAKRAPEIVKYSALVCGTGILIIEGPARLLNLLVSERHPRWSALLWVLIGSGLLAAAAGLTWTLATGQVSREPWKLVLVAALYFCLSLLCYRMSFRAIRRGWTQASP
jgi:hypothetical protein